MSVHSGVTASSAPAHTVRGAAFGLSRGHRRWLHRAMLAVALTGLVWMVLHYGHGLIGMDGRAARSVEAWCMKLHGAAVMAALVAFGSVLPHHVRLAWRARRHRLSGGGLIAAVLTLVLTGYGLYYLGDEDWHDYASWGHQVLAAAAVAACLIHLRSDRRARRE
ncbi:hypothetical protein [Nitrospirillum viridazoti]|uniref:DUF4405 domain-containing protein n=1 Tax=Nitrospirillum amazonense TaxID=28077 RepID=A0A560INI0_9PROT|nr:hypothetical protein [Nitrospirillum amazonense]TWB60586.1 hypothetical protein FBZ92_106147 [Nitrospirillum amazonense]